MKIVLDGQVKSFFYRLVIVETESGFVDFYKTVYLVRRNDIKIKGITFLLQTIERDEARYMECLKNIKKCGLDKKINVVYQDALDVNLTGVSYDLIFIDAAKGQYTKFFEKYKYFLNKGGVIITDNINFHGYVGNSQTIESKNLRQLVSKIESYLEFLKNNEEFTTEFLNIGDGISVSRRKNEE